MIKWAKAYVKRYEALVKASSSAANIAVSQSHYELYSLAQALLLDQPLDSKGSNG